MFSTNRFIVASALLFTMAGSLLIVPAAMAQNGSAAGAQQTQQPPQPLPMNDPRNPFHFTTAQQLTIASISANFNSQAEAISQDTTLTIQQKQTKLAFLQKQAFEKFSAALTPAQAAKAKSIKLLASENGKKIAVLKLELTNSLSPSQRKQAMQINASFQTSVEGIKNNSDTNQSKQQEFQQLQLSAQQQMNAIWTPSQRAIIAQIATIEASGRSQEAKILASK